MLTGHHASSSFARKITKRLQPGNGPIGRLLPHRPRLLPVSEASTPGSVPRIVVGAAIRDGRAVLAAARAYPPALAGLWEFPGGKLEPGETEAEALRRECREELGVDITVGERVTGDLSTGDGRYLLRVYYAALAGGEPHAKEHAELRWLQPEELDSVPWLPGNRPAVDAIREALGAEDSGPRP